MVKALTRRLASCGLVPLRVALSLVFIGHGGQKLFVMGISGTSAFMSGIGIPTPTLAAVVVIFVELLGGIAVLLGVWAAGRQCFCRLSPSEGFPGPSSTIVTVPERRAPGLYDRLIGGAPSTSSPR